MARLYTLKHGKGFIRTGNSYRSNLDIVNKETLVHVAQRLGVEGVAKSHSKERMADAISGFVLSHPEECLKQFSVKELLLLKDFVDEGADTSIVRPNRKYYDTLRELLFVSAYHDKKKRSLYFLLPVSCVSKFSTETEVMNYSFGVLTIEGIDESDNPYVVSLI